MDWGEAGDLGGWRELSDVGGGRDVEEEVARIVVVRPRFVVSAEGGGGREDITEARQRKHSPVPKYLGDGWGKSDR
jgi:hypothetical protein